MDASEMVKAIKRVTYKPNFTITVRQIGSVLVNVKVVAELPDSENPKVLIKTGIEIQLHCFDFQDAYDVHKRLESMLDEFEMHEMYEWFRIDGKKFSDPHKKGEEF